jgi:thiamine-phosphate pyrophosphorylase
MQLCAITDRKLTTAPLLNLVEGWSNGGVHFIQLREKDLDAPALQSLAQEASTRIDRSRSKLLLNVPAPDWAALARTAGADGVHLAGPPRPGAAATVRQSFPDALISLPCHSLDHLALAVAQRVDLILFSPVFEKLSHPIQGLEGLRHACAAAQGIPVFALGGVTAANAAECVAAGATGIAAIRLFAGDDWRRLQNRQGEPIEPYIVG